ncbi:MAG: hypothetical protein ACM3NQ_10990, partial [Bacteroidales bacterium]
GGWHVNRRKRFYEASLRTLDSPTDTGAQLEDARTVAVSASLIRLMTRRRGSWEPPRRVK